MEYVKLYVTLRDDPKVIGLSDEAFRSYVMALCWSGQHETDGELPAGVISSDLMTELRKAGLLDKNTIHNWSKRQLTHAELDAKRIAGRKAAGIRWGKAFSNTEVEVRGKRLEVQEQKNQVLSSDFDPFWTSYPRKEGKGAARKAFTNALKRASLDAILAGAQRYRDDPNREDGFTAHPATWLNRDGWEDDPLPSKNGNGRVEESTEDRLRRLGAT